MSTESTSATESAVPTTPVEAAAPASAPASTEAPAAPRVKRAYRKSPETQLSALVKEFQTRFAQLATSALTGAVATAKVAAPSAVGGARRGRPAGSGRAATPENAAATEDLKLRILAKLSAGVALGSKALRLSEPPLRVTEVQFHQALAALKSEGRVVMEGVKRAAVYRAKA